MKTLTIACIFGLSSIGLSQQSTLQAILKEKAAAYVHAASATGRASSSAVYASFARMVASDLKENDPQLSERIIRATNDPMSVEIPVDAFAWITHAYALGFYKDEIIRNTSALIKFKTYATDVPNRVNPEFIKQREFLLDLATRLGLQYNDVGGYVQEIWIGDGIETLGLMSHSDVQPVQVSEWNHDPWSGEVSEGKIWGRGAIDDKGPIVAIMYGMRAILDSKLPIKKKIILLIGTDEESANEDVTTYLKSNPAPDRTLVVDSNYPVICAEKGWCGSWMEFPRVTPNAEARGLLIVDLHAGFSPSIVPALATATIVSQGVDVTKSVAVLKQNADSFNANRKGADIDVEMRRDTIVVRAKGKSVHSSAPQSGHNALVDLLVFLDRDVQIIENEFSHIARFASRYIGFDFDGRGLGISHHDDFMGDVTVAVDMAGRTDSSATLMFNFRIPKGVELDAIEDSLATRYRQFDKDNSTATKHTHYLSEPLFNDPSSAFVTKLLTVYNEVTGENRHAQSIGGGTYAKRIPNAVVFGPAMPDEEYTGHQPNEFLSISTLERNIEILIHTMVLLGL